MLYKKLFRALQEHLTCSKPFPSLPYIYLPIRPPTLMRSSLPFIGL